MKYILALLLVFVMLSPLQSQEIEEIPDIPKSVKTESERVTLQYQDPTTGEIINLNYVQEVAPDIGVLLNKNILFVVDCSGSMSPSDIGDALLFITGISSQAVDEMQIGVLAFDEPKATEGSPGYYRWPGIPEPNLPVPILPGWAALPSVQVLPLVTEWLIKIRETRGKGTMIIPALMQALTETHEDLSIVVVTDGALYDGSDNVRVALRQSIEARHKANLQPVNIMVYGISRKRMSILVDIAEIGGGGYYYKDDN